MSKIYGQTQQSGTPTPNNPVPIWNKIGLPEADNESIWNTVFEDLPEGIKATATLNSNYVKVIQKYINDNYVSKELLERCLTEAEERYKTYKEGVKENENLKPQMWKYIGEMFILKKVLGKDILRITTLD